MTPDVEGGAASAFTAVAGSREVWWLQSRVDVKLTAAQTGGHVGLWYWIAQRGAAAPMHVHSREDEQFLIVEGSARFVVGGERFDVGEGDLIFLPRTIPHGYVVSSRTARLLGMVTPGGFEGFFADLGRPVQPGERSGPAPEVAEMARVAPRYGVEVLGPPPLLDSE